MAFSIAVKTLPRLSELLIVIWVLLTVKYPSVTAELNPALERVKLLTLELLLRLLPTSSVPAWLEAVAIWVTLMA